MVAMFATAKLVGAVCTANMQCVVYGQCGAAGTGSCQCMTSYTASADNKSCDSGEPLHLLILTATTVGRYRILIALQVMARLRCLMSSDVG